MALERLWRREAQIAAADAEASFAAQQAEILESMSDAAFQQTVTETHANNMAKLAELKDLGVHLAVPELAEEIHQSIRGATLECRPLSWTPYAPATIDPSLTARDGLMAIHGWTIAPQDSEPNHLSLFVGLYHEKRNDAYLVPKMVVNALLQKDPTDSNMPVHNLERLLQQDSAAAYEYLSLLALHDQRSPSDIGDPAKKPELEAFYKAVMGWSKRLISIKEQSVVTDILEIDLTNWELGNPEWAGPHEEQLPMTLERHVKAADNMLQTVVEYGLPASFVPADALDKTSCVYQSGKSLTAIEKLFAPTSPTMTKNRWSKKVIRPLGIAANATLIINPQDAYIDLRERADTFYDEAQSPSP